MAWLAKTEHTQEEKDGQKESEQQFESGEVLLDQRVVREMRLHGLRKLNDDYYFLRWSFVSFPFQPF